MFLASIWSFSHFRGLFPDRVIHFGETLGNQAKSRSPKKLQLLIEVTNVVHEHTHTHTHTYTHTHTRSFIIAISAPTFFTAISQHCLITEYYYSMHVQWYTLNCESVDVCARDVKKLWQGVGWYRYWLLRWEGNSMVSIKPLYSVSVLN